MKNIARLGAVLIIGMAAVSAAGEPQTVCPVDGMAINKDIAAEYNGQRVYFCSQACAEAFKKSPAKYVKEMESKGVALEKAQTKCAVNVGNPINKKIFVDYEGKRIYFCCFMCPQEFKKDPAKYIQKMEAAGIVLEKAPVVEKEQEKK